MGPPLNTRYLFGFILNLAILVRAFNHLGRLYFTLILMGNECFEVLRYPLMDLESAIGGHPIKVLRVAD